MRRILSVSIALATLLGGSVSSARADWLLNVDGKLEYTEPVLGESTEGVAASENKVQTEKTLREINANALRLKFEADKEKMRIKALMKNGQERDLGEQRKFLIRNKEGEVEVRASDESKFKLRERNTESDVSHPVSVDMETKTITITTPSGEKKVKVLPDAAIRKLVERGIINASTPAELKLEVKNGQSIYRIDGVEKKRFLGILPIKKTVEVSAETGEPTEAVKTRLERLRDILSF